MSDKEKYKLGSIVTARSTYNGEIITGEFYGFYLLDKSNPKSIVGVIHTSDGSYYVEPNSIESVISEDERIRKELISFFSDLPDTDTFRGIPPSKVIAWLENQGKPQDKGEISDEFTQCNIELFDKKFPILPKLKGKQLHDYKNFLNKCQQIFGLKYWGIYPKQSALFEKLTLLWATWGAYNLKLNNNTPTEDTPENSKEEIMVVRDDDPDTTNDNDLTKSKERKSKENMIEPKFKVGDWIISDTAAKDYCVVKINEIKDGNYHITSVYGYRGFNSFNMFEKNYHLWTIQDAKDGDVLFIRSTTGSSDIFILFYNIDENNNAKIYCSYDSKYGFIKEKYRFKSRVTDCKPATKEQRDTLFKAMADAGYTFDFDKKELKKIEQKPAWSEENLKEFNVEEYYKNPKRKVVTRDGREVEILKIDTKTKTEVPVIAMMDDNDIRFYTANGRLSLERETCSDLFFADADCDTCTNDKGCVACKNSELYEGKPLDEIC